MSNNVVVFVEQRDGKVSNAALQALTPGRELADKLGGKLIAVTLGSETAAVADAVDKRGIDQIVEVNAPELQHYSALRYRSALAGAVRQLDPKIVLLAASFMGRDLAPRVAARLGGGVATDCVELHLEDGGLRVKRPIYNGKAFGQVTFPADRLAVVSVRPNSYAAPAAEGAAAERSKIAAEFAPGDERLETMEVVRTGGEVKDVTEADIVVTGGRSLKSEENFTIIYELAKALDGAVGASRAACDAGYQPHSRQVGLTGKTVTPKLYVACGVSGAIQHLAGMRGSKVIVAINTDPEAPIFNIADYGIVDDLFKVVPALTDEVKKLHA